MLIMLATYSTHRIIQYENDMTVKEEEKQKININQTNTCTQTNSTYVHIHTALCDILIVYLRMTA